ncbi:hypothetical protein ACVWXM_008344 [Bradyrhizobium sp. GM7.3]
MDEESPVPHVAPLTRATRPYSVLRKNAPNARGPSPVLTSPISFSSTASMISSVLHFPAGDDNALAVGSRGNAFGIIADIDALERLQGHQIEHADSAAILIGDEAAALRQRHRIRAHPDLHAAGLGPSGDVDHGDVVGADIGGVGALALGIDGDAERTGADLDGRRALARRGVDHRHTVVVAVGREQQLAIRRYREPRWRGADRNAGRDAARGRVDHPHRRRIPVRDIDGAAIRRDGNAERPAADLDPRRNLPRCCVHHRHGFGIRARDIGKTSVRADGDAGRLAADRDGRDAARRGEVHDHQIVAELVGDECLFGEHMRDAGQAKAGGERRQDQRPHRQLPLSIFFLSASRPAWYSPFTALTAASSLSSGGGSLLGKPR